MRELDSLFMYAMQLNIYVLVQTSSIAVLQSGDATVVWLLTNACALMYAH